MTMAFRSVVAGLALFAVSILGCEASNGAKKPDPQASEPKKADSDQNPKEEPDAPADGPGGGKMR